jgi:hypothetical protein
VSLTGLKYYDDIKKPIPRAEVSEVGRLVECAAKELFPGCTVEVMGSYRRGSPSSHDVDCLVTNTKFHDNVPPNALADILALLVKQGVLVAHLSMPLDSGSKAAQYGASLFYQ